MDARGIRRILERTQGLAETAEHVGMRSAEGALNDPRLSEPAKQKLAALYREHSLQLTRLHAALGLAICDLLQDEAEDASARGELDLFRANFSSLHARAQEILEREFGSRNRHE